MVEKKTDSASLLFKVNESLADIVLGIENLEKEVDWANPLKKEIDRLAGIARRFRGEYERYRIVTQSEAPTIQQSTDIHPQNNPSL